MLHLQRLFNLLFNLLIKLFEKKKKKDDYQKNYQNVEMSKNVKKCVSILLFFFDWLHEPIQWDL